MLKETTSIFVGFKWMVVYLVSFYLNKTAAYMWLDCGDYALSCERMKNWESSC